MYQNGPYYKVVLKRLHRERQFDAYNDLPDEIEVVSINLGTDEDNEILARVVKTAVLLWLTNARKGR